MITDPTLGLNNQALAVLYFMARMSPDFADYKDGDYQVILETRTWYNGRERGFTLNMSPDYNSEWIHLAVFEHRNSDEICVLNWTTKDNYWNGATADNSLDEAYHGGTKFDVAATFKYGEIGEVANYLYEELEKFYEAQKKKMEAKA